MEARFISSSTNNNRRSMVRWSFVGLVLALAVVYLVVGCDPASNAQEPTLPPLPTESPTPSATSTPLVVSSADSETQPTWTATSTPRRATALAMTLQAQRDLTQTRVPGTPTPRYTITRTFTITPTWSNKIFPTVTLRKWPTYTFTPRPTYTRIPTMNIAETKEKLHEMQTATRRIDKTRTATAMVDNDIMVANVSDPGDPSVVLSATDDLPLLVNATWYSNHELLFEGHFPDQRRLYTLTLPDGIPERVPGQNSQLNARSDPPKNNKDNIQPALSPDGEWIAFSSLAVDDRTHHHLFIMSSDGSILYQVTKGIYSEELQPSWSPDGKYIVFISVHYGYIAQIFKLNVTWLGASSHAPEDIYVTQTPLTSLTTINIETAPRYCMDTDKPWIVFSANYGGRQIYVMRSDGTDVLKLTKDYGNSFPDWSSDCDTIIFMQDQEVPEIYTMSIEWDGDPLVPSVKGDPKRLIHNESGFVSSPHYSPDGSKVVYIHKNHQ